jgi:hypothetical protein
MASGMRDFMLEVKAATLHLCLGMTVDQHESQHAIDVWSLWWRQERAEQTEWAEIVRVVVTTAPQAVVRKCAEVLAEAAKHEGTTPRKALLLLAGDDVAVKSPETALHVLDALERLALALSSADRACSTASLAYSALLRRALERFAADPRVTVKLGLLAWRCDVGATLPRALLNEAQSQQSFDVAQLLSAALESESDSNDMRVQLRSALVSLGPAEDTAPAVQTFITCALARGLEDFCRACDEAVALATELWHTPAQRAGVILAVLEAELQTCPPVSELVVERLSKRFEEALGCLENATVVVEDWWVRYVELAHIASRYGGMTMPSINDIHWRAMRSVPDQSSYLERVHSYLQASV